MNKTIGYPTRNPSPPLCHLPGTFFKDLQTNFPETFHASSGMDRSCFTLHVFTKNHQKLEAPQHTPATTLASVPQKLFSPIVTFKSTHRCAPIRAARVSKRYQKSRTPNLI
jgi:hypothetical protein